MHFSCGLPQGGLCAYTEYKQERGTTLQHDDASLLERLQSLDALAMHMPGHKRNELAPYLTALGAALDITEIEGFDNLHQPQGVLARSMELAAQVFGAQHTLYSVNGSTAGILAGIGALAAPGDTVLVARNCHMSVIHALRLHRLNPVFLHPPLAEGLPVFGSLPVSLVADALAQHPKARLVVLTSPTYEGVLSDVQGICAAAHSAGAAVLVDEAHGAHLGLGAGFPSGAVAAGADVVVQSLHKTLPSLTQTAVIHVKEQHIAQAVARGMRMFETSSPSYLLLASIDSCVRLLAKQGPELMARWRAALDAFAQAVSDLRALRVVSLGEKPGHVWGLDPSKLLIHTRPAGLSGPELAQCLREQHGIECEMALPDTLLAMTGMGDTQDTLLRLAHALVEIDRTLSPGAISIPMPWPISETVLPMNPAATQPWQLVPRAQSLGKVCAEMITLYPPGAPLLLPGERITAEALQALERARMDQSSVFFERGSHEALAVVSENVSNL